MRVNSNTGNQANATPRRSVYDGAGADRLGDVQERDDGFVARDRQGNELGVFASLETATVECWRAARDQMRRVS
jgi:hypothetical protein